MFHLKKFTYTWEHQDEIYKKYERKKSSTQSDDDDDDDDFFRFHSRDIVIFIRITFHFFFFCCCCLSIFRRKRGKNSRKVLSVLPLSKHVEAKSSSHRTQQSVSSALASSQIPQPSASRTYPQQRRDSTWKKELVFSSCRCETFVYYHVRFSIQISPSSHFQCSITTVQQKTDDDDEDEIQRRIQNLSLFSSGGNLIFLSSYFFAAIRNSMAWICTEEERNFRFIFLGARWFECELGIYAMA